MPDFLKAKRISIYLSTENEVSTLAIIKKIFEDKKEVAVKIHLLKSF